MRFYLESYGCSQSHGEGAAITRDLVAAGHAKVDGPVGADLGVLVTCGVIGATEARMVRRWRELARRVPHVVVTGCLVPLRTDLFDGDGRSRTTFVPIRKQSTIAQTIGIGTPLEPPPDGAPETPTAPVSEEVVIQQGCTSHCTYCFSRLPRGPLLSRSKEAILAEVGAAVKRGVREIRLTSLDTSAWGLERLGGDRLPGLVSAVDDLSGDFRVLVGMMSPQTLYEISDEYLPLLTRSKVFSFLHLPAQSGSDDVLRSMRRGYTVAEFRHLVEAARETAPTMTLATDLIVGYPTETETDFEASLKLLETTSPEIVNVTRFSARPLTPAARLNPLPPRVLKNRSRALTELRLQVARRSLERWVGREEVGLIVEHGRDGTSVARLPNYLPVVVPGRRNLGERLKVVIDGARSTYLLGDARPGERSEPLPTPPDRPH